MFLRNKVIEYIKYFVTNWYLRLNWKWTPVYVAVARFAVVY